MCFSAENGEEILTLRVSEVSSADPVTAVMVMQSGEGEACRVHQEQVGVAGVYQHYLNVAAHWARAGISEGNETFLPQRL